MINAIQRREGGQSLVELAVGMAVLILLFGGLVDLARGFVILVAVENAAGEGALYGATNPECLTTDHAPDICQDNESVAGRVREEGEPVITITDSMVNWEVENGAPVTAGSTLRVDVTYRYQPLTPFGFLIWGSQASVTASARQQIMSPPPPGYNY